MSETATQYGGRIVTLRNNCIQFRGFYKDKDLVKSIEGRRWNPEEKVWEFPLSSKTLKTLASMFPGLNVDRAITTEIAKKEAAEAAILSAKLTDLENVEPIEPMPLKTKPFRHQIAAYNLALQIPAAGLLMEQGTGKSLTAVAIMGRRFTRGEIKRVLIVAPSSVVPVWPKEFDTHANFPHDVRPLEGPSAKRAEFLKSWKKEWDYDFLQVAVVNYEGAWRIEDAIREWKPDMIVCDESQRIKTPGARQSKALHNLGKIAKYRLILTGTPVTQGPLDFFSQYKFLDPSIFGNSYFAFRARYAIMGGYENRQIIAYNNLPELIRKAHSIAFRVTKAEALDLPEMIDQEVYCDLEPKAERMYKQLAKESIAELSNENVLTAANILSKLLRLSQLTGGFLTDGSELYKVSTAKLDLLKETLEGLLDAGKKIVIFAQFVAEIHAILKLLDELKVGYAWIAGEVQQEARGEEVRRFQEDPDCKVFVAQTRTAGLGITLTAADTAIFYSLSYSFADYDQARCRIHRIGQKNNCTYIHLIARGTVDEKVLKVLKSKKAVADQVVDDWRKYFE